MLSMHSQREANQIIFLFEILNLHDYSKIPSLAIFSLPSLSTAHYPNSLLIRPYLHSNLLKEQKKLKLMCKASKKKYQKISPFLIYTPSLKDYNMIYKSQITNLKNTNRHKNLYESKILNCKGKTVSQRIKWVLWNKEITLKFKIRKNNSPMSQNLNLQQGIPFLPKEHS